MFINRLSSSSNNDQLSVSLNVLVNLYRDNVPAQTWAISNPQHDAFQKKLVSLLPNKSVAVIIASLHLLAILSLKEKLGEKVSPKTVVTMVWVTMVTPIPPCWVHDRKLRN